MAYFNIAVLPKRLEDIPLEYFGNAITWASDQSVVDTSYVVLLGVSRGAELALLLASHYANIKGVIAYAPGCFVLPSISDSEDSAAPRSSWSWRGQPLPFAPVATLQTNHHTINFRRYVEPLLKDPNSESYTIPVERAKCAILLLSGADDQVWPAAEMAMLVDERLTSQQYAYSVRNVIFPKAGHSLFQMQDNYQVLSSALFRVFTINVRGKQYRFNSGGTAWANVVAKRKARAETLQFLNQIRMRRQSATGVFKWFETREIEFIFKRQPNIHCQYPTFIVLPTRCASGILCFDLPYPNELNS